MRRAWRVALLWGAISLLAACGNNSNKPSPVPSPSPTIGDTGTVSGYVVNRKAGMPVAGTNVAVEGHDTLHTTTDSSGYYSLSAPVGHATLTFTQEGYAQSKVEGLKVTKSQTTHYDTIQMRSFDASVDAVAPSVTVNVDNGAVLTGSNSSATDSFDVTVSASAHNPEKNRLFGMGVVSLGFVRGFSGYWSAYEPNIGVSFGNSNFDGSATTVAVPASGYNGDTSLHVVVLDQNLNRTEVVRYVTVRSSRAPKTAAPVAPTLSGLAVTWGDVAYSSFPMNGPQARAISPQNTLDEHLVFVDLSLDYEGFDPGEASEPKIGEVDTSPLPEAFEIYRKLEGESDFRRIARTTGVRTKLRDLDQNAHTPYDEVFADLGFRDASPALTIGKQVSYRVDAVTGDARASSDIFTTTPVPPLRVAIKSPVNKARFTSLQPEYQLELKGTVQNATHISLVLLDATHGDFASAGFNPIVSPNNGETLVAFSHAEVFAGQALAILNPYHAYTLYPVVATSNGSFDDEGAFQYSTVTAIAIAADYFGNLGIEGFDNFDSPASHVQNGPTATFTTGDGQ